MTHTPASAPRRLLFTAVAALALVVGAGCAAKNKEATSDNIVKETRPTQVAKTEKPAPAPAPEQPADTFHTSFGPIFYALDSAQLLPESTATLQNLADYLRQHPGKSVTIHGHTCELGTSEYNLALGQKRAHAAKSYLTQLGVSAKRVDTLSFGEERPAAHGHAESDFSQNRRSEFDFVIGDDRQAGR